MDILVTGMYSIIGIILMLLGIYLVDLIIPCHFPTEIKKGNKSVGFLTSGISIAVGLIIKSAIMSPAVQAVETSLIQGITSTALYFGIGIVFCIVGYYAVNIFNKSYNLNTEIGNGNEAAGIMMMGFFIGLGLVISGVIY